VFTPSKVPRPPATHPTQAANRALDEVFMPWIAKLATSPVQEAGQQAPGMLRPDGLGADRIRAMALRWCAREQKLGTFDHCALQGLQLALECYTDAELTEMVTDAALGYSASNS